MTPAAQQLLVLDTRCCRWPIGRLADPSFRWCGKPAAGPGKSYCSKHQARARLTIIRAEAMARWALAAE